MIRSLVLGIELTPENLGKVLDFCVLTYYHISLLTHTPGYVLLLIPNSKFSSIFIIIVIGINLSQ